MAQEQIKQLTEKLEAQQAEFDNYKQQCKQLEQFLQQQSTKKEQEIRKLKEEAIKKEKNFGLMKTQLSQLEAENANLKTELNELKQQQSNIKPQEDNTEKFTKQIQQLKKKNQELKAENQSLKQKLEEEKAKAQQNKKSSKGAPQSDKKKVQDSLAASKAKIAQLQKQNEKLKQQLSKKHSIKQPKQPKTEQKKGERDNKQEQRLRQKVERLQKKLSQSQSETNKAQQTCLKLSKQIKQLKSKASALQSQKQHLSKKIKQLAYSNSIKKQEMKQQNEESEYGGNNESRVQNMTSSFSSQPIVISALIMTKKHYASPFMEIRNDNSIKILKSTKNGCFEKSLGSLRYKLNNLSYDSEQILESCANTVKQNLTNGIKSSVVLFGPKKSTKKYLLATLISKLKDFLLQRMSASQQKPQAIFIKASPDPQKKLELVGHSKQEIEEILNKILDLAQKSPKKNEAKKKAQPKPKVRLFKFWVGQAYLQIITTSFTNIPLRQSQTMVEALNNICYSRVPNALQPMDCHRQIILMLNPIVNLYDDCKNTLSITNCKKSAQKQIQDEGEWKADRSPIKQELNDAARKKLESIERQSQQSSLKIRKQQQQINFYKNKFDELQVRLKNLLNTHRQQNTYLKKSPVTLSYQKMLKFVQTVQAKNPTTSGAVGATTKFNEEYSHFAQQVDVDADIGGDADENQDQEHENHEQEGEQIL